MKKNILIIGILFVLLCCISCSYNSYQVLPNSIVHSKVERIKIEYLKEGIQKVRVVSNKEEISFLYDFFYKHEKKIEGLASYAVYYKITFYSKKGNNIFSFNNGNGIIYNDLNNNTYYYLNTECGKKIIDKYF